MDKMMRLNVGKGATCTKFLVDLLFLSEPLRLRIDKLKQRLAGTTNLGRMHLRSVYRQSSLA